MVQEIWKDVIGWENYYQVSNTGYVRSKDRYIRNYRSGLALTKGKLLSLNKTKGYLVATLFKDKIRERYPVHRLVALHFLSNAENKPTVNHINTIKDDNRVENLEWCTESENIRHAIDVLKKDFVANRKKKVLCTTTGEYFESAHEASRKLNLNRGQISNVCRGVYGQHKKLQFKYV